MQRILNFGGRRRHLVEIVEEPVDGGRLLRRVGDVATHQLARLAHRLVTEFQAKLTGQLGTQQVDLAAALRLDAFRLDLGLGSPAAR